MRLKCPDVLKSRSSNRLSGVTGGTLTREDTGSTQLAQTTLSVQATRRVVAELRINWLLLLTGTPVQNNMRELWGIMNLLDRRRFARESAFLETYGGGDADPTIDQIRLLQVLFIDSALTWCTTPGPRTWAWVGSWQQHWAVILLDTCPC